LPDNFGPPPDNESAQIRHEFAAPGRAGGDFPAGDRIQRIELNDFFQTTAQTTVMLNSFQHPWEHAP
jgi:hypothetical protein